MSETRDLLMRTKRLFTSGHWTRGALLFEAVDDDEQTEKTYYCLIGGLRLSAGHADVYSKPDDPVYLATIKLLAQELDATIKLLAQELDNSLFDVGQLTIEQKIVIFNDRIAKGVDDVVALIDRVVEDVS